MRGYTVIDIETTGFSFARGHRIVELGVVEVSPTGEVEHSWETLINPQRHLAATEIHGITATDVFGAPTFADIADKLVASLDGRILVAHNAGFDCSFISQELMTCGRCSSPAFPAIDTVKLARTYLGLPHSRLADCCEHLGISNKMAHSALSDAIATAHLLQHFLWNTSALEDDYCREMFSAHERFNGLLRFESFKEPTLLSRLTAQKAQAAAQGGGWFQGLVDGRQSPTDEIAAEYFRLLDAAFLDRQLSATEQAQLLAFAKDNDLNSKALHDLHESYITLLVEKAWEDGVITQAEREILVAVGKGLGFSEEEVQSALSTYASSTEVLHAAPIKNPFRQAESSSASQPLGGIILNPGDRVTVTGAKKYSNSDWADFLGAHGVELGGLAKKTKVLVAANPDSQSGKAKKAKSYGIPIVAEEIARALFHFTE